MGTKNTVVINLKMVIKIDIWNPYDVNIPLIMGGGVAIYHWTSRTYPDYINLHAEGG